MMPFLVIYFPLHLIWHLFSNFKVYLNFSKSKSECFPEFRSHLVDLVCAGLCAGKASVRVPKRLQVCRGLAWKSLHATLKRVFHHVQKSGKLWPSLDAGLAVH